MLFYIVIAALTGATLAWAVGRPVDNWLEARLSVYPKKTIITACLVVLVALAVFGS